MALAGRDCPWTLFRLIENCNEDPVSGEESRFDFDYNELGNREDEKTRASDDEFKEIDRSGWEYLIPLFIVIYFYFYASPNLVMKLTGKMLRKKEIQFMQVQ